MKAVAWESEAVAVLVVAHAYGLQLLAVQSVQMSMGDKDCPRRAKQGVLGPLTRELW